MAYLRQGVLEIAFLNVPGASGYNDIDMLLSDDVFTNPSITVIPVEESAKGVNYRHAVTVFMDGEVVEHHAYGTVASVEISIMSYPNRIFPPNVGISTKPGMRGWDPGIGVVTVRITNFEDTRRTFKVLSTHDLMSGGAYKKLNS